jgi:hypothetical protein
MDKLEHPEQALLARVVEAMEPLGLQLKVLTPQARRGDHYVDAKIDVRLGAHRLRYVAEVKRRLRPETLGAVLHQLGTLGGTPLLVTDHVTPPLADALRARGVEFVDTAGNVFLNRPPLLVFVKGQRPVDVGPAVERSRAFQTTGLQVLFTLLARPQIVDRPYREIAQAAGVAHGTVGWVMAELPGLGHIAKVGGRRRLINGERLMDRWTEAFARTLRPKLLLGRFRGDIGALHGRTAPWPEDVLVGGELAAALLTRHLRPGAATFYARAIDPKVIVGLGLKADANGNVEIRRRFWTFPREGAQLAPTLLVYADLIATGDARCLETAQLLRGQLIARLV